MILDKHKFIVSIRNKLSVHYIDTGKNISFDIASEKIGITKGTLSRTLQGKNIDLDTFFKICSWLDCTPNDFVAEKLSILVD